MLRALGDHIRQRRLDLGLLQSEVGDTLGVSESSVWNWERNRTNPEVRFVPKIYDFLGYCPWEALGGLPAMIRRCRMAAGLSQEELARKAKIDESTIAKWERGETCPLPATTERLTKFFRKSGQSLPEIGQQVFCGPESRAGAARLGAGGEPDSNAELAARGYSEPARWASRNAWTPSTVLLPLVVGPRSWNTTSRVGQIILSTHGSSELNNHREFGIGQGIGEHCGEGSSDDVCQLHLRAESRVNECYPRCLERQRQPATIITDDARCHRRVHQSLQHLPTAVDWLRAIVTDVKPLIEFLAPGVV